MDYILTQDYKNNLRNGLIICQVEQKLPTNMQKQNKKLLVITEMQTETIYFTLAIMTIIKKMKQKC